MYSYVLSRQARSQVERSHLLPSYWRSILRSLEECTQGMHFPTLIQKVHHNSSLLHSQFILSPSFRAQTPPWPSAWRLTIGSTTWLLPLPKPWGSGWMWSSQVLRDTLSSWCSEADVRASCFFNAAVLCGFWRQKYQLLIFLLDEDCVHLCYTDNTSCCVTELSCEIAGRYWTV